MPVKKEISRVKSKLLACQKLNDKYLGKSDHCPKNCDIIANKSKLE